jgi:hypothetical protein
MGPNQGRCHAGGTTIPSSGSSPLSPLNRVLDRGCPPEREPLLEGMVSTQTHQYRQRTPYQRSPQGGGWLTGARSLPVAKKALTYSSGAKSLSQSEEKISWSSPKRSASTK